MKFSRSDNRATIRSEAFPISSTSRSKPAAESRLFAQAIRSSSAVSRDPIRVKTSRSDPLLKEPSPDETTRTNTQARVHLKAQRTKSKRRGQRTKHRHKEPDQPKTPNVKSPERTRMQIPERAHDSTGSIPPNDDAETSERSERGTRRREASNPPLGLVPGLRHPATPRHTRQSHTTGVAGLLAEVL